MLFLWQLVNFRRADVLRQAPVDLRDGTEPFGRRLTCGGKKVWERGCMSPAVLGKISAEISRMASALHTHTHTQAQTHTAEILAFGAELQLSSFSVYSFFFEQLGSKIT